MLSIAESLHLSEGFVVHRLPDRFVQRALQRSLLDLTQPFVITNGIQVITLCCSFRYVCTVYARGFVSALP